MDKSVMVVDDEPSVRYSVRRILENAGLHVIEVEDGQSCIDHLKKGFKGLILMDITMPDMDGIQALKGLLEVDPNAKVAMCSAMGQQGMVIESLKLGAKDFVVKPFDVTRVIGAVKKMVG